MIDKQSRSALGLLLLCSLGGCSSKTPPEAEPPTGMVHIVGEGGGFYIDPYEFPSQKGVRPRNMVIFNDARRFCGQQGKRLCTDGEWRRACLGPEGKNTFGYGPTYQAGACYSGTHLKSGHSGMTMEKGAVALSGTYVRCRTEEGVFDMVGNLEEWVLTRWNGTRGILEGGAWFTIRRYASCTGQYSRQPHYRVNPKVPVFSAGFRCCWSQEAPTEAELDLGDLEADTRLRLTRARRVSATSAAGYDPDAEVEFVPGTFIDRYEYPNRPGGFPRVAVNWIEADKLCRKADKRLCSPGEWERACVGSGRRYPYGDRYDPTACAVNQEQPQASGARKGCAAESGAMDLSGGVWEWTAGQMAAPPEVYGPGVVLRHVRGGSYYVDPLDATCRPEMGYPTVAQTAVFEDLGFRCCRGKPFVETFAPIPAKVACPEDMVAISDFCVDRYEFPNKVNEPPLHDINFKEALRACASVGLHVCTEAEWSLACGGRERRSWPYGNTFESDRCHYGLVPDDENTVVVSGSMARCQTVEGIFDMSGNVWEWTRTTDEQGELRGGGANISAGYGRCNSGAKADPTFSTFETGVRCCATATEAQAQIARGGRPTVAEIMAALKDQIEWHKAPPEPDRVSPDPSKGHGPQPGGAGLPPGSGSVSPVGPDPAPSTNPQAGPPAPGGKPVLGPPDPNRVGPEPARVGPPPAQASPPPAAPPPQGLPPPRDPSKGTLGPPDPNRIGPEPPNAPRRGPEPPRGTPPLPQPVPPRGTPPLPQPVPPQLDPKKIANVKRCSLEQPACPSGLVCCFHKSVCCLAPVECNRQSDCADGERCYLPHRRCYLPCATDKGCHSPYRCDSAAGVCHPPGPTCVDTDECPVGLVCVPGRYYCAKP